MRWVRLHTGLFTKHNEGAAIIEFAVVAPALFLMLIGFIELGLILFATAAMEGATNIGSRIGKVNYGNIANIDRETYIRQRINFTSGGFLDPNLLNISIMSYNSFNNIGQPEPCIVPPTSPCPGTPGVNFVDVNGNGVFDVDQGKATAGGAGAVVLYRVTYPWQLFTPLLSSLLGTNGVYNITAVAAVRNEQF